jgi:hypothetical protein
MHGQFESRFALESPIAFCDFSSIAQLPFLIVNSACHKRLQAMRYLSKGMVGQVMNAEESPSRPTATPFWKEPVFRAAVASLLLLTPCFWHRYIEAGDLGSHVYNAWLVELIHQGKAPGLWIATQWNNVLFDWILSCAGRCFGLIPAEKIAVSISVLIFFWGAFSLISALTGRRPWFLLPVLAMVAYGWTFYMGFFNYYLSIGLSFWTLAGLLRWRKWWKLLAAPLGMLTYVAHPLGSLWLVGAAAYIALASAANRRMRLALLGVAVVAAILARHYLRTHFETSYLASLPAYEMNGSDQIVLRMGYHMLAVLLEIFGVGILCIEYIRCRHDSNAFWSRLGLPIQLYVVTFLGIWALPDFIVIPDIGRFGFVSERLSLISAVLAGGAMGAVEGRRGYAVFCSGLAAIFFSLNFQDTAVLARMETRIDSLLATVGPGRRIMSTIDFSQTGSRLLFNHMVDRQCIGRCLSFGNYEPATGHFRVRAMPGNRIVAATKNEVDGIWGGAYVVQAKDLPACGIYQPGEDWTVIAIRPLSAGEKNGRPDLPAAADSAR